MIKVALRRLLIAIPTFIGVSIVAFLLIRLAPGDPVELMIGERGASPEVIQEIRTNLGFDKSPLQQYLIFIGNVFTGDFGTSIISRKAVSEEFMARFPATVELSFVALIIAIGLGIPIGILAAAKRNSFLDYLFMGGALVGYSMPIFWWGLILILLFSVNAGLTPVSGRISVFYDIPPETGFMLIDTLLSEEGWEAFWDAVKHLILPAVALGTIPLAAIARMTRSSLLEVLREDYIRTATAKGLSRFKVITVHALKNALIPIVTIVGLMVGTLLTGAILTETIFSWPGIGRWLVASVTSRDYPVIQGGVMMVAGIIIFVNLTVDIIYIWINPHMRDAA